MNKATLFKRATALVLAASMLTMAQPPVITVDLSGSFPLDFKESDIIPNVGPSQGARPPEAEVPADDEVVRVTIVLEEASTIEAGYSISTIGVNPQAVSYRNKLEAKQRDIEEVIEEEVLGGEELDVAWNLTLAANAISANVEYGLIEDIKALDGVVDVFMEAQYAPAAAEAGEITPNMFTSDSMIGSDKVDYTGAGKRIAVIDTGIDDTHQSFDEGAFNHALAELEEEDIYYDDLLDKYELSYLYGQLSINEYIDDSDELYKNSKIPFAYNYIDHSSFDTDHLKDAYGNHGSHVAGIAAANRYVPDGNGYADALEKVNVQGVAPDAQLLIMKVFGSAGGPHDSEYMVAIEDAIILGADAINLSLGVENGFATPLYYQEVMNRVKEEDIVLTVSAGNSGSWGQVNSDGYTHADDVNMQMLGSPSSYKDSLSVASAENNGFKSDTGVDYFIINDKYYTTYSLSDATKTADIRKIAEDYQYIFIDSVGTEEEFDALIDEIGSIKGKIVVCNRGEISFVDKANAAFSKGAAALIVVNNTIDDSAIAIKDYGYAEDMPVVMVSLTAGDYFRLGTEGTVIIPVEEDESFGGFGDDEAFEQDSEAPEASESEEPEEEPEEAEEEPEEPAESEEEAEEPEESEEQSAEPEAEPEELSGDVYLIEEPQAWTLEDLLTMESEEEPEEAEEETEAPAAEPEETEEETEAPAAEPEEIEEEIPEPVAEAAEPKEEAKEVTYFVGTLTIPSEAGFFDDYSDRQNFTMSDFSSWGITGSLELKPEITAPGGNIYSVIGGTQASGSGYGKMSGTSMAAPQVAGMAALLSQYIDDVENYNVEGKTLWHGSKRDIIQSLLMSTAIPGKNEFTGNYYSVLQQGAGLANVGKAIDAETYIMIVGDDDEIINTDSAEDGKVKAELGDDPDKNGVYSYSFTITNMTDEDIKYKLYTDMFTQGITGSGVKLLATVHGERGERESPLCRTLFEAGAFRRRVWVENHRGMRRYTVEAAPCI